MSISWAPFIFFTGVLFLAGCSDSRPPSVPAEKTSAHQHDHDHDHDDPDHDHDHAHGEALKIEIDQQKANRFEFEKVQLRTNARAIQTTGVVTPDDTRVAHVRPISRGRILRVRVRVGDRVRKGQELLSYDNIELGEMVGQYRSAAMALERSRTESEVSRKSWERAKNLVELGVIAAAELERREAEYQNSQAIIQERLADVASIDEKLHRFGLEEDEIENLLKRKNSAELHREYSITTLRAPFDGIVIRMNAAEGETIQVDDQVFDIVDTHNVWVQADLYGSDVALVREGSKATVLLEGDERRTFAGRVSHISDVVDPTTRTVRVRVEVPNPDRQLKLDMFATIRFSSSASQSALSIPASALQQVDGKQVVFVRENPTEFELREVEIGPENQGWVEVRSGAKENETVVTRGSFVLKSEHQKAELGEGGHTH